MITVKHRIDPANEAVYCGTHTRWHEQSDDHDPQATALEILDRDAVVATIRHDGICYVMNDRGSTVASYVLPPSHFTLIATAA